MENNTKDSPLFDELSIKSLDGRFFEVSFIVDFSVLFNILNIFGDGKKKS